MLELVLGEGRQISVVDPASEVVPHMPCVNELVGAVARQEPSIFLFLTAVSKLLKLYEKENRLSSSPTSNRIIIFKLFAIQSQG
jgi:hypothetical protein